MYVNAEYQVVYIYYLLSKLFIIIHTEHYQPVLPNNLHVKERGVGGG